MVTNALLDTAIECTTPDAGHGIGNVHASQTSTVSERTTTDGCHGVKDSHASQPTTISVYIKR